ncbi:M23 family metallopeptidase [Actinosynnema sp. NPDC020468]|uniref:M23 family metallopeptidase n=1 Tax=Actinosynnema sp. NPDC020468 TaxID=3154488 RepID=UPI0033F3CD0B
MEGDRHPLTGKVAAAVIAAGAIATTAGAAHGFSGTQGMPLAGGADLAFVVSPASSTPTPTTSAAVETVHDVSPGLEAAKLMRSEGLIARQHVDEALQHAATGYTDRQAELQKQKDAEEAEKARVAAEEAAKAPKAVVPAVGIFTSGFGGRWGTTHYGVDIANAIGTPIVSVMEGTIVEAGPASGFGLWVRVQHADGTITVYGHMNEILVTQGQHVAAGQQIATIGNRGQSTGPHLHFEVWIGGSQKIDPLPWLAERGINL